MLFQRSSGRLSGRLNYYITRWRQEVRSWSSDELETRCGREIQQKAEPPGLRLSIKRTRTTHGYVRRGWWSQYVAVFVRLKLPLTRKAYNKVRGIFFFWKKSSLVFIIVSLWFFLHESAYETITIREIMKSDVKILDKNLQLSVQNLDLGRRQFTFQQDNDHKHTYV